MSQKLSFSFSGKKKAPSSLKKANVQSQIGTKRTLNLFEDKPEKKSKTDQVEFITEVDESGIVSLNGKEEKGPLIIPLPPKREIPKEEQEKYAEAARIVEEKKKKLHESAKNAQNDGKKFGLVIMSSNSISSDKKGGISKKAEESKPLSHIPIVAANRLPGIESCKTEKEKYEFDIARRPKEEDYDRVPVEEFGAALLRGMGWKEGQAIGRNKKNGLVEAIEYVPRPQLLGLGATPMPEGLEEGRTRKKGPTEKYKQYKDEKGKVKHFRPISRPS